jgi:hypothetical protein
VLGDGTKCRLEASFVWRENENIAASSLKATPTLYGKRLGEIKGRTWKNCYARHIYF